MKRIISFVLALTLICGTSVFAHPFSDVTGHWAEAEIEKAFVNGSVNGDPDGSFRPDDSISRAEFLKMLVALLCELEGIYVPESYDDGTHWASKYYNFAVSEGVYKPLDRDSEIGGIIPGEMSAENFDRPIGRWEMSYIVSEAMQNVCGVIGKNTGKTFADAKETAEDYPVTVADAIENSYFLGIMTGDENGFINPGSGGTRAEAVVIVNRVAAIVRELQRQAEQKLQDYEQQLAASLKTYEEIPDGHPVVTILMENNKKIMIELYPEYAPQTVANFVALVKSGFYDGLTFHRVVDGFVAQGGDPNGNGTGGSGTTIVGEFASNGYTENTLSHTKGVISMARSSNPNSASSQFFICYDDASHLDGYYAAFGKVIMGMNVVEDFTKVERSYNSSGELASPVEPVVMKRVTVSE